MREAAWGSRPQNAAHVSVVKGVKTSHHEIVCVLPSGLGADLSVSVSVAKQISNSNIKFSYDKPTVNAASRKDGPTQLRTVGGDEIVIRGSNFGPSQNNKISVYIADAPCNEPVVVSDSEIHCMAVEGIGKNQTWSVTVGDQKSVRSRASTSYTAPVTARI